MNPATLDENSRSLLGALSLARRGGSAATLRAKASVIVLSLVDLARQARGRRPFAALPTFD
jgi:hypothetical protein